MESERRVSDNLTMLQAALGSRLDACWDRLDDVVSELAALHEVDGDVILARVRALIAAERPHETRASADKG